jgi:phytoene desaturase
MQKAIIIGSGVAGLATAIRLAVKGYEVTVYEKNSYPGGKLSVFEKEGYVFDAGPSLFTNPHLIEELFTLAGEPIKDSFSYTQMSNTCTYFYADGTTFTAPANTETFAELLQQCLGENKEQVIQYLTTSKNLYNHLGNLFLNNSLHKVKTFFTKDVLKAITTVKFSHLIKSLHQYNSQFSNPKTTQLFNRFATYNGSNPYKAPAMLSLIPHLEHGIGTFYPKGGMISITKALYNLAIKRGVQFVFNTEVQRIIYNNKEAKGVVVNNQNIYANTIVSNMDVYFTYKHLLQQTARAKKILKQERSSSALIFYWGIKKVFPQLGLHNILFSNNYQQEFASIFNTKTFYNNPTVYINITSTQEQNVFAPAGCQNWFVMVNVPANNGQNWEQLIPKYRQAIIEKISQQLQTNIQDLIEVEETLSPQTIETKTQSYMGSLYGTSSNSKLAAFLRHPNFSSIKGLYFVGGSVHPGGGIPLCLQSAKIVDGMV